MYSFGGDSSASVYLDARVDFVTPGTMIFEKPLRIDVPLLTLQYPLDILDALSAIFGAMQTNEESPEVYIWDEHLQEPEVAVFFRTKKAGKKVLDDIAGKTREVIHEAVTQAASAQAFSVAEVNLRQHDIRTFIREYEACNAIVIDVRETGQPVDDEPVSRFLVQDLIRRKPRFDI